MRAFAAAVTVGAALQTPACASDWVAASGRLRHPEWTVSLADAAALGPGWERIEVEGAELAYRGPDGAVMSYLRECGSARERSPRLEARQLLLGLEARDVREEGALELAGAPAWRQRVAARDEDRAAYLTTVTRVAGACREDFVLATPEPSEAAAAVFGRWWRSYRAGEDAAAVAAERPAGAEPASPEPAP